MSLFEAIKQGTIIGKYLVGKETKTEMDDQDVWLKSNSDRMILFKELKDKQNIAKAIETFDKYDSDKGWKKYVEKVLGLKYRKVLFYWRVAAVFFFLVSSSVILLYVSQNPIVFGNRQEAYTTITTNKGQNTKIYLPDSSVVWINSATQLSYNTDFAKKNRNIRLSGQAFFEIKRNEKIPLIVNCNGLKVKVLGTKFDVSAYPEERMINVVLVSGKVELSKEKGQYEVQVLNPKEMGRYDVINGKLTVSDAYSRKFTSWKDGILIFENDAMSDVFNKLERWYNIKIDVKDKKINQLIFNATIVNESIEEIFELMKFSCGINYQIISSDKPEIPVSVIISK